MWYAFVKQILCFLFCISAVMTCQVQMLLVADISLALPSNQKTTKGLCKKKKAGTLAFLIHRRSSKKKCRHLVVSSFSSSYYNKCNKLVYIFVRLFGFWLPKLPKFCSWYTRYIHSGAKSVFPLEKLKALCANGPLYFKDGGIVYLYRRPLCVLVFILFVSWYLIWLLQFRFNVLVA